MSYTTLGYSGGGRPGIAPGSLYVGPPTGAADHQRPIQASRIIPETDGTVKLPNSSFEFVSDFDIRISYVFPIWWESCYAAQSTDSNVLALDPRWVRRRTSARQSR